MGHFAKRISRRTVLKGLGVSLCVPFLEAMEPLGSLATEPARKSPVRMAVLYFPNGVNPHAWAPEGVGADFKLSSILAPLNPVRDDILVLSQLMNKQSIEGDGHYVKVAPFLTGTHITKTTGSDLRCGGVSMDQIAALRVGNMTPLPSLELSVEPPTTYVDTNVGYTALYGSHISWNTPTTPVTREVNPQLAFDRLFRHAAGSSPQTSAMDSSVLDLVTDDAKRLEARVGAADRAKLSEYYEAVRSVEKRIALDRTRRSQEYQGDPEARREIERLGGRIRDYYQDPARIRERGIDHTEQVRLMLDIMVLAFWTDTTRVATFMFGNEVSGRNFSFLPGVNGSHHEISHHQDDKTKLEEYRLINIWHVQQYAYMLGKMKAIKERDSTLLDNSMVLLGGGMRDGNAHSPYNLPIVLAGRGGGRYATGRHLAYAEKTPLCGLYRSMLNSMGAPVDHFGDAEGELPGLTDGSYRAPRA